MTKKNVLRTSFYIVEIKMIKFEKNFFLKNEKLYE